MSIFGSKGCKAKQPGPEMRRAAARGTPPFVQPPGLNFHAKSVQLSVTQSGFLMAPAIGSI